jgi:putative endonuclease
MKPWYLYILRCSNGALYTGITTDVARRFLEHCESPKAARFTRSHRPLTLVFRKKIAKSRGEALKIERRVKKLPKAQKEMLVMRKRGIPVKREFPPEKISSRQTGRSRVAKGSQQ